MSIIQPEIKVYKAVTMNDTGTNGGRMSANLSITGVKNNVWPDITQPQRVAGGTWYRKLFVKVNNTEGVTQGLALQGSRVFVENYTPGEDSICIFPGTHNDIQSELTGSERLYGNGQLDSDAAIAATSMSVATEGVAFAVFQDGDLVRISDKTDVNDGTGVEEYVTITSVPTYSGDVATFNFTPAVSNAFVAVDTRVCSVIESFGDVDSSVTAAVIAQGSGTIDDTTYPIVVPSTSGIDQEWTLTFTNSTDFTITGNTLGLLGTGGTVTTGASPNNPDYSNPYFILDPDALGGTFADTDTITFTTTPCAMPIWERRDADPGIASTSINGVYIAIDGSSA